MNQRSPEQFLAAGEGHEHAGRSVFATAAWHSLAWLVTANLVGVLLAVLLLFPLIKASATKKATRLVAAKHAAR
jgi:cytochrome c oxidase cbb3-type subunit 1